MKNLQMIGFSLRVFVLLFISVSVMYVAYSYIVNDVLVLVKGGLFDQLWENERANRTLLLLTQLPHILVLITGGYWLQRLLGNFQRGDFFTDDVIKSFFWLIWLKVISILLMIGEDIYVAYYHSTLFEKTALELNLDIGESLTMLLLLLVAYMLKAAKDIEAENKEFI